MSLIGPQKPRPREPNAGEPMGSETDPVEHNNNSDDRMSEPEPSNGEDHCEEEEKKTDQNPGIDSITQQLGDHLSLAQVPDQQQSQTDPEPQHDDPSAALAELRVIGPHRAKHLFLLLGRTDGYTEESPFRNSDGKVPSSIQNLIDRIREDKWDLVAKADTFPWIADWNKQRDHLSEDFDMIRDIAIPRLGEIVEALPHVDTIWVFGKQAIAAFAYRFRIGGIRRADYKPIYLPEEGDGEQANPQWDLKQSEFRIHASQFHHKLREDRPESREIKIRPGRRKVTVYFMHHPSNQGKGDVREAHLGFLEEHFKGLEKEDLIHPLESEE